MRISGVRPEAKRTGLMAEPTASRSLAGCKDGTSVEGIAPGGAVRGGVIGGRSAGGPRCGRGPDVAAVRRLGRAGCGAERGGIFPLKLPCGSPL